MRRDTFCPCFSQKHYSDLFIRSKDEKHLESILKIQNIEKIDGFVLAKFSLTNCEKYMHLLQSTNFYIMPSIEGFELLEYVKLQELKQCILTYKHKVLLVRFGLEDMLKQLSMKRTCNDSVFDLAVGNAVLGNFIGIFKSAGFAVSGGVYPCLKMRQV
ncbi:MAG: HpcH/HpaI aldolase/citrate lyase family protein [Campylobacterales bacterium]|nr:HpcH/HpaI aldolase/citrate lyase family protein [Campylobacterales bacterium]